LYSPAGQASQVRFAPQNWSAPPQSLALAGSQPQAAALSQSFTPSQLNLPAGHVAHIVPLQYWLLPQAFGVDGLHPAAPQALGLSQSFNPSQLNWPAAQGVHAPAAQ
jgi:hypothetical protein